MTIQAFKYKSPVGDIYCIFEGQDLIKISIKASNKHAPQLSPAASCLLSELEAYFKGNLKSFKQKIKFISGTEFQHKVWLALKDIPYGETRSYKWIAEKAGNPKATRAAGQALKKNPLPIILPCHRVIASDGSIGGFSCGVSIKKRLLMHETIQY
jgi:methylated-DNA-[protein]-cysteine S-methyltransferase